MAGRALLTISSHFACFDGVAGIPFGAEKTGDFPVFQRSFRDSRPVIYAY